MKRIGAFTVALFAAGCVIREDIPAPPGQPSVIAQMVLNTASPVQSLILERSDGAASRTPLNGANVTLTHLTPDASCTAPVVTLQEVSEDVTYGLISLQLDRYQTTSLCSLHPGDRVALRIETPQGEVVTGTTRIPGPGDLNIRIGSTTAGSAGQVLPLDRTRDSMRVMVNTPQFAQGLQIEVLRKGGNPRRTPSFNLPTSPAFDITTDTMHAAIAGSLLDPFEGRTLFHAGVLYLFSVAATDTNYYDFVRSGDNPLTGRGFINHLSSGIGVFGSVAPQTYEMPVRAPQQDTREGKFHLTGQLRQLGNVNVDVMWDLYLDAINPDQGNFSALMDGTWVEGPVHSSVDGRFRNPDGSPGFHAEFYGDSIATPNTAAGGASITRALYEVDYPGSLPPRGTPFTAQVSLVAGGNPVTDQVTVVQTSGP